jgi:hypothetical protein
MVVKLITKRNPEENDGDVIRNTKVIPKKTLRIVLKVLTSGGSYTVLF